MDHGLGSIINLENCAIYMRLEIFSIAGCNAAIITRTAISLQRS
jgi:hypothetical protein